MDGAKETAALEARGAGAALPPGRLVRLAVAFYGAVFAAAVAWRWLNDGSWPWRVGESAPLWPLPLRIAAGLALGAGLILASRVWTSRSAAGRQLARELGALVAGVSTAQALLLAALSGIAEEASFRGALQPRVGWPAASLLFALAHGRSLRARWLSR